MSFSKKILTEAEQSNLSSRGVLQDETDPESGGSQDWAVGDGEHLDTGSFLLSVTDDIPETEPDSYSSQYLTFKNMNFDIPEEAVVRGLSVNFTHIYISGIGSQNVIGNGQFVSDYNNYDSTIGDAESYMFPPTPSESQPIILGGVNNTWGISNISPEVVNSPTFGFRIDYFWDTSPSEDSGFLIVQTNLIVYYSIYDYEEKTTTLFYQTNLSDRSIDGSQDFSESVNNMNLAIPAEQTAELGYTSQYLSFGGFDFNIPDNKEIKGIEIYIPHDDISSGVSSDNVAASAIVSDYEDYESRISNIDSQFIYTYGNYIYVKGGDEDLWGSNYLTRDIVNSENFGIQLYYDFEIASANDGLSISYPVITVFYDDAAPSDDVPVTDVSSVFVLDPPIARLTGANIEGTTFDDTIIDVETIGFNPNENKLEVSNRPGWIPSNIFINQVTISLKSVYPAGNYPIPDYSNRIFSGSPNFDNSGAEIYYTLNGKTPTRSSRLYRQPLIFKNSWIGSSHVVLKYRVFYKGKWSPVCRRDFYVSPGDEYTYGFENSQEY